VIEKIELENIKIFFSNRGSVKKGGCTKSSLLGRSGACSPGEGSTNKWTGLSVQ